MSDWLKWNVRGLISIMEEPQNIRLYKCCGWLVRIKFPGLPMNFTICFLSKNIYFDVTPQRLNRMIPLFADKTVIIVWDNYHITPAWWQVRETLHWAESDTLIDCQASSQRWLNVKTTCTASMIGWQRWETDKSVIDSRTWNLWIKMSLHNYRGHVGLQTDLSQLTVLRW